jgi:hypothetical protein
MSAYIYMLLCKNSATGLAVFKARLFCRKPPSFFADRAANARKTRRFLSKKSVVLKPPHLFGVFRRGGK